MRPVYLEFAGLQSYREPQSIDFTRLMGGGLFGIFGPTGSGKSTILDAMTLALYGRVMRAGNDTRSILNQGEKQLWVKFTFSLKDASGEKLFRVERGLTRTKDGGIRTAQCRLIEVSGGESVLADQEGAVSKRVEAILGLTVKDFTRAVVLPQGQFAEFLQLGGKDRRQMLERIFALGQFGDGLNTRLKNRLAGVETDLTAVVSGQTELGDASAEAAEAAAAALAVAEQRLRDAQVEHGRAEQEFRQWERVWELQQDLARVAAELAAHIDREPQAQAWRIELDLARRAEHVRHPLEARVRAGQEAELAAERLARVTVELEAAVAAERKAVAVYTDCRARRDQLGPALVERRMALQRAVTLEADAHRLSQEVADLTAKLAEGKRLTGQVEQSLAQGEQATVALQGGLAETRAALAAVEVPPGVRQQVEETKARLMAARNAEAVREGARRRLESAEAQVAAARAAVERAEAEQAHAAGRQAEAEDELSRLTAEPPATDDEIAGQDAWLAKAELWVRTAATAEAEVRRCATVEAEREEQVARAAREVGTAAEEEARLRRLGEEAQAAVEQAQARREAALQTERAAILAHALTPGQPCPVCGALEHPMPAQPSGDGEIQAAEAAVRQSESERQEVAGGLEQAVIRLTTARSKEAAALDLAREAGATALRARAALEEAAGHLPEAWRTYDPAGLPALLEAEQQSQTARRTALQAWKARVEQGRTRREEMARAAGEAAAALSGTRAGLTGALELREAVAREVAEGEGVAVARRAEFEAVAGGLDETGLSAAEEMIRAKDRERVELTQTLERLNRERDDVDRRLAEDRVKLQRYQERLQQRENELARSAGLLEQAEQDLARLAGGAPAQPQLAAAEAEIARLEGDEAAALKARETAEGRRAAVGAAHAAAMEGQERTARRLTEAEDALGVALATAGFAEAGDVTAALRTGEVQARLDSQVREFEQAGHRIETRRSELVGLLGGRKLDEAGWAGRQAAYEDAREALALRQEDRVRAAQTCEELGRRQTRWKELEARRQELTLQRDQLAHLQTLLRGNAFVEWVAREHMEKVSRAASQRLAQLTRDRYSLEVDADGAFEIKDNHNGGARRPVSTLSGGETFLASLSLALALSLQIQLHGRYPLEFFFLDEGFGTLDPELLDTVISALEQLHLESLNVGVISHVPELRARLQRRVIVEAAEAGGRGSRLRLEYA